MEKVYDTVTRRIFTIYNPFETWVLDFEPGRYIKVPPNRNLPLNLSRGKVNKNKHY